MKNQTIAPAPRLMLKKQRIVCLTSTLNSNASQGKSGWACNILTIGGR